LKHIFLIVALSFGIFFTSCNKQAQTSTEVKITSEQIVHKNLDVLKTKTQAPLVTRKDSIRKLYAIIFKNHINQRH
jgi:hypothetical protein